MDSLDVLAHWTDDEIAAMAARIKRFGWPYRENAEAVVRQVVEEQERLRPDDRGAVDREAAARALHKFGCEACTVGTPCPYDGVTDWCRHKANAVIDAALGGQ